MQNRVIVAGSRGFEDYGLLQQRLDKLLANLEDVEVVSGGAKGADALGEIYAELRGLPIRQFLAQWDKHGRGAGYRRNEQMAQYATHLVAFNQRPGGTKGTNHMIQAATQMKLKVRVVWF